MNGRGKIGNKKYKLPNEEIKEEPEIPRMKRKNMFEEEKKSSSPMMRFSRENAGAKSNKSKEKSKLSSFGGPSVLDFSNQLQVKYTEEAKKQVSPYFKP